MRIFLTLLVTYLTCSLAAIETPSSVVINNRPLIKIQNQTLSLLDVIKKMDLFIEQGFPQAKESPLARMQFYMHNWQYTLNDLVDDLLILQEAEDKEIKVSDGDVHEEMNERFGSSLLSKIDAMGMRYDDIKAMLHSELMVKQILSHKVHTKTMQQITPSAIKEAYSEYVKANPPKQYWTYQTLTFRGEMEEIEKLAHASHALLKQNRYENLSQLYQHLQDTAPETVTISLSPTLEGDQFSLSQTHLQVLNTLSAKTPFSSPVKQAGRLDTSFKIFHFHSYTYTEPEKFEALYTTLQDDLYHKIFRKEKHRYTQHLRRKYNIPPLIALEEDDTVPLFDLR